MKEQIDQKKVLMEARQASIELSKRIVDLAHDKSKTEGTTFAALTASMTVQSVATTIAIGMFEPGTKDGEKFLMEFFQDAYRDAVKTWYSPSLRQNFTKDGIKQ